MNRLDLLLRCLISLLLFNLVACSSMQTVSVESAMQRSQPRRTMPRT
jgi:uncharacterized protein YcfL